MRVTDRVRRVCVMGFHSDDYDVFTYNGDNWYHQHNQSLCVVYNLCLLTKLTSNTSNPAPTTSTRTTNLTPAAARSSTRSGAARRTTGATLSFSLTATKSARATPTATLRGKTVKVSSTLRPKGSSLNAVGPCSGTESEMLFSQKGLDTANHQVVLLQGSAMRPDADPACNYRSRSRTRRTSV